MRLFFSLLILIFIYSVFIADGARRKSKKGKWRKSKFNKSKKPTPYKKYEKYTEPGETCPCWWDITKSECGCCKNGGVQCGFPLGKYCYKKSNRGCTGVSKNKLTLSQKGFPCYWDQSDLSCAWCIPGSYQCNNNKGSKNTCENRKRGVQWKCDGVKGDCGHLGKQICDMNAECVKADQFGRKNKYICKCKDGWTGNGLQCVDENGNFGEDPNKIIQVEMMLTNDFVVSPHDVGVYPFGPSQDNLFSMMGGLFDGAPVCNGCNATLIHLTDQTN